MNRLLLLFGLVHSSLVLAEDALDICASLSCLFKNGSSCDRARNDCPRCLVHDPLLSNTICAKLQSDTMSCQTGWTLCPATPLDGEDANSSTDYTWVAVDSSDISSSSGSNDSWVVGNGTSSSSPPVSTTPAIVNPATASIVPASSAVAKKATSEWSPLPTWLIISLAVVGVLVLGIGLLMVVDQRLRRQRVRLAMSGVTPTPPPTDDEPVKSVRTGVSYGIGHEIESLRSLATRDGRVSSIGSVPSQSSSETAVSPRARPRPLMHLLFPVREPRTMTTAIPEARESLPTTPGSLSQRSGTPCSQPTPPQLAYPLSLELSRLNTFASRENPYAADGSPSADVPDIFLTDRSVTSQFTNLDYVDTPMARGAKTKQTTTKPDESNEDTYPDTSLTSESQARGKFSPLSMRARDTAAFKGDVVDEWASTRTVHFDVSFEKQKKSISKWKAKYFAAT